MDAKQIFQHVGGRKAMGQLTGLGRSRMCQWEKQNDIPLPWIKFLQAKFPVIAGATLQLRNNKAAKPPTDV